ncbi:thioredoxin family protein [Chryseobacterium jejuense]|uniref:AhpC/TSA family protein n=1 Tax=Chryseobacterium jejuense TaxID=445960 RepID=A0A2X2ZCE4_CHRJE|nr:thioredoxin family protein [Chryseobacterium jejuense]SDI65383.1 AhpC/TSA family protein [Chryseobacterium jejuense]SQB47349.1 Thiol-disulfide oxidoreductase resA [Chryseobacterium jejuense]
MKNMKTLIAAFIAGLGLLSFTTTNHDKNEPQKETVSVVKGYEVGDEAADFKLKNIDGKMVSLSDFKTAKGFIVIFTCNHCPYAKKYEDRIIELDKKYKAQGYPVIAINPNDPTVQPEDGYKQMIERAKQKGFTFPYLMDEGQKIYPQYGATKTPHVFILQKENSKNIVKYIGAIDNNYDNPTDVSEYYAQDAVNALIKGEPVKMTKTVAIGCTIKVKK